jgi:hypothetical protein
MFQTTLTLNLEGMDPAVDQFPQVNQQLGQTFFCGNPGAQWSRVTYDGSQPFVVVPLPTYSVATGTPATNLLIYNQPLNNVGVAVAFNQLVQGSAPEVTTTWQTVLAPGQSLLMPYYAAGNPAAGATVSLTADFTGYTGGTINPPIIGFPAIVDCWVF